MKSSTHLRLANLVATELGIKLDSEECAFLRGGSIEPDKWKDYPHHFGVDHKIKSYLIKSRSYFLEGNSKAHLECLGIAFHYTADKWTLFSGSAAKHAEWEEQIDKCNICDLKQALFQKLSSYPESLNHYLSILNELHSIPDNKQGSLAFVFRSRPIEKGMSYSSPEIDFNFAFRICLALGMSVRSMSTPPKELMQGLSLLERLGNSGGISDKKPPTELEVPFQDFQSRLQLLEKQLKINKDALYNKKSNFLSTFLYRQKTKASINHIMRSIKTCDQDFREQIKNFTHKYQDDIDWYYWATKGSLSLWKLHDLFEDNSEANERNRIISLIKDKTCQELTCLYKAGYQLVIPNATFTIKATFDNPLSETIANVQFILHAPSHLNIEIKPNFFSIPPHGSVTPQAKIQIRPDDILACYLLEMRFSLHSIASEKQSLNNSTFCGYPVEETSPLVHRSTSNLSFISQKSNFLKLIVVSDDIRKLWLEKSTADKFCSFLGCDSKQIDFRCPKCNLYFCNDHKQQHMDCEKTQMLAK